MKNCIKPLSILALLSFTLSSCGVMFGGSKYTGLIIAEGHPEAQVYVNGINSGRGKAIGLYPRRLPLTVELQQEGCEPQTHDFDRSFRLGPFILNLVSWGPLGIAIDLVTGASFKPAHKSDPEIEKVDDRNFIIAIDYSGCPTEKAEGIFNSSMVNWKSGKDLREEKTEETTKKRVAGANSGSTVDDSMPPDALLEEKTAFRNEDIYTISGVPSSENYSTFYQNKTNLSGPIPVNMGIAESPVEGLLSFYVEATEKQELVVNFFNREEVKFECDQMIHVEPGLHYKAFDISSLESGSYIVLLMNKEETKKVSLIIEINN